MVQQERHLGETEIVLAHCAKPIKWLGDAVCGLREKGANVTHVHIVSKCGYTPNKTSLGVFVGTVHRAQKSCVAMHLNQREMSLSTKYVPDVSGLAVSTAYQYIAVRLC